MGLIIKGPSILRVFPPFSLWFVTTPEFHHRACLSLRDSRERKALAAACMAMIFDDFKVSWCVLDHGLWFTVTVSYTNVFRPVLLRQFPKKKKHSPHLIRQKKSTCVVVVVYLEEKTDQKSGNNSGGSGGWLPPKHCKNRWDFLNSFKNTKRLPGIKKWIDSLQPEPVNQGFGHSPKL